MANDTVDRAAIADLDRLLGDPADPANPYRAAEVLAADERGGYFAAGRQLLDGYRVGADLVPPALGGRLAGLGGLVDVLRALARHDLALCLGGTPGSAVAALTVWACGTAGQQLMVADALLDNATVAASGRPFEPAGLRLHRSGSGLAVDGRSADLDDAANARLLLLCARTGSADADQLVLVEPHRLPAERFRRRTPVRTVGLRGIVFAGLDADECPVPPDAVLPPAGGGMPPVAYAALAARLLRPAAAIGTLDSALRIALRYAADRRLNGRPVADLSNARRILTEAFVDLLVCDCLTTAGIRALGESPGTARRYAATVDALVPRWLAAAVHRLSTLMGATFYLREGRYGVFQKHLRDLNQAVLGTADELGRQAALVAELSLGSADLDGVPPLPDKLADVLVAEQRGFQRDRDALPPATGPADLTPAVLALCGRYARLLAAQACLEMWTAHRGRGLLGGFEWLRVALGRLGYRADPSTPDPVDPLWTELVGRHEGGRTFDVVERALPY